MKKTKKYAIAFGVLISLVFLSYTALAKIDNSLSAIEKRIKPIGNVKVVPTPTSTTTQVSIKTIPGESTYNQYCVACHSSGAAGAPKFGDTAAWEPRTSKGIQSLYQSALHGYKIMPPKGGCLNCTDDQIKNAVDYMVSKSKS